MNHVYKRIPLYQNLLLSTTTICCVPTCLLYILSCRRHTCTPQHTFWLPPLPLPLPLLPSTPQDPLTDSTPPSQPAGQPTSATNQPLQYAPAAPAGSSQQMVQTPLSAALPLQPQPFPPPPPPPPMRWSQMAFAFAVLTAGGAGSALLLQVTIDHVSPSSLILHIRESLWISISNSRSLFGFDCETVRLLECETA